MLNTNVSEFFKEKKCLVTGGTGMIGVQVVDLLVNAGAKVKTVSLDRGPAHPDVPHIQANVRNKEIACMLVEDAECVFHVAGLKGSVKATHERPADFYTPILELNTSVLDAAMLNHIEHLVYVSSIGAYAESSLPLFEGEGFFGDPMDYYPGMAKRAGEIQVQAYRGQYGVKWGVVRPTNVYGPHDKISPDSMVVTALIGRLLSGEDPLIVWGDGTAERDFTYSQDIAEGIIHACYYGTAMVPGGFVNLSCGRPYSIEFLLETLRKVTPFNYQFDTTKPSGVKRRVMRTENAREFIHWQAETPLFSGLLKTWEWFEENNGRSI